ncbi:N-6 DNA methylase [Fulvivirgaceae bacterium BMA12]|uniref:site-specific DNA-methyltransferase (adenine-specific) n=1 Tax=Agaribacillus aureus TaxID=3051825 RepID=A0ABT8LGS2_9BACT|nr:N-6 DNA methylase [Fulvivirgaceae bacterium BMA12]
MGRTYELAKVFNDLLTIGICSYNRTNIQSRLQKKDEASEALYMETIKRYEHNDLKAFGAALGILKLNVWDNPYSDILGDFYMDYITNGQNGQYFTPAPVCEVMAKLQLGNLEDEGNRILDPACGSGRMLLSTAKLYYRNYFFGADNNNTCAKMATLNFFFNGLQGEIAWMNSLSMEWYGGWHINRNDLGIVPIEKEQSEIWSEAPKAVKFDKKTTKRASQPVEQLSLF